MRLEQGSSVVKSLLSKFQFHKGAIRTDNEEKPTTLMLEFQFHKGAIRTHSKTAQWLHVQISIP